MSGIGLNGLAAKAYQLWPGSAVEARAPTYRHQGLTAVTANSGSLIITNFKYLARCVESLNGDLLFIKNSYTQSGIQIGVGR